MGQYFQIVNIDKRQTTGLLGVWGQLTHYCGIPRSIRVKQIHTLAETLKATDLFNRRRDANGSHSTLGSFTKIPVEMIDTIFKALPTLESAIMLAITNSHLFTIGYPTISQILIDSEPSWAHDRIICIGEYADDLPVGCLSEDEKLHLWEGLDVKFNLYHVAYRTFRVVPASYQPMPWRFNTGDSGRYHYLKYRTCKNIESPVLINTTKKQYICQSSRVDFEVVIPQLVVWGEHQWAPWAGDRLAVTSMDDLVSRMELECGWKDFTDKGLGYQERFLERLRR